MDSNRREENTTSEHERSGGAVMTNPNDRERTTLHAKRYRPNTQDMKLREEQARSLNVGTIERVLSGMIGAGLLWRSLKSSSTCTGFLASVGALMGLAMLHRATTGFCAVYAGFGLNTHEHSDTSAIGRRKVNTDRAIKIEQSVIIHRSPQDLFQFWRQVENLPKVMSHLQSVSSINEHRSHWVLNTMAGRLEWDAEIINEVENERIGWRSLHGATVDHAGSVAFIPVEDGRSTRVTVMLQYDPPAGPIGAAIASLFGQDPGRTIHDDLLRFKQRMESRPREVA
jgi:uncharacterized membrane protein